MAASFEVEPVHRVGEVIETSTIRLWVESDRLHDLPPLGSVVGVAAPGVDKIFAVVSFGQTAGIDASRRAIRRGSVDVQDEEVYRQHPELAEILRTTFEAVPVAYREGQDIYRILPPVPPPLHYSVETVQPVELQQLTDDPRYLTALADHQGEVASVQLLAAHLRAVYDARGQDRDWLHLAAREVSRIYKDDYDRLLPVLEAIDPGR